MTPRGHSPITDAGGLTLRLTVDVKKPVKNDALTYAVRAFRLPRRLPVELPQLGGA